MVIGAALRPPPKPVSRHGPGPVSADHVSVSGHFPNQYEIDSTSMDPWQYVRPSAATVERPRAVIPTRLVALANRMRVVATTAKLAREFWSLTLFVAATQQWQ